MICVPSEDSDQPGHPPSLIRVFAVRSVGSQGSKVFSCGQRRLWSDWADAQADLSLCWAHRSFCWFCLIYVDHVDITPFWHLSQSSMKTLARDTESFVICQLWMSHVTDGFSGDSYLWRCPSCSHKVMLRLGSFWEGLKLSLSDYLEILYVFSQVRYEQCLHLV